MACLVLDSKSPKMIHFNALYNSNEVGDHICRSPSFPKFSGISQHLLGRKKWHVSGLIDLYTQNSMIQFTAFFLFCVLQIVTPNPGRGLSCNWGFKTVVILWELY
jgi:hypothetical protein